ncbi:hypothetical protein ACLX1H_007199 [Fusarium chlamydosporum]
MEIKKQPVSIHVPQVLEGSAASSSRVLPQGSQRNAAGVAEGELPKSFGNSLMPMASASYSQPDLSGNAGFGTRVDSMTRWMTPRRTNTLEIEEGKIGNLTNLYQLLYPSKESTTDILDVALKSAKGATYAAMSILVFLMAGFIVLVFFFYEYVVPAVAAI